MWRTTNTERIKTLEKRMETMTTTIQQLTQDVGTLKNSLTSLQTSSNQAFQDIGAEIAALKQQVANGQPPDFTDLDAVVQQAISTTAMIQSQVVSNDPNGPSPVTLSISPSDGSTAVPASSAVVATFSAPVLPATLNATNFTVTSAGVAVQGSVTNTPDNLTATFTPGTPLAVGANYSVALTGVQDANGKAIAAFSSGFAT